MRVPLTALLVPLLAAGSLLTGPQAPGLAGGRAGAAAADPGHAPGWSAPRRWRAGNDWEPNVAADPSSPWLYQMTTRYGGPPACRPHMDHCIMFRASPDRGGTWRPGTIMNRAKCPPGRHCRLASAQNDPVLAVSRTGVIYAAWMNNWDVVFAKSRDHGRTWTPVHDFRRAAGVSFTDKPWIAISRSGRDLYVAFNRSDSYISASHDYGRTWSRPVRTNRDGRYWFAEGGAVAPDGRVFFAESAEHQDAKGAVRLAVVSSADGGASWATRFVARSQQQPRCPVRDCPNDFYGAQISLAAGPAGGVLAVYAASTVPGAPMKLYAITSRDGVRWSAPADLGARGARVGADFPKAAAGPEPGDFRVAWADDRNGPRAWNIWYRASDNGGLRWTRAVRVSAPRPGSHAGFPFPYGDYFGLAVDGRGASYLTWSQGRSYDGPGGTWWAASLRRLTARGRPAALTRPRPGTMRGPARAQRR